MGEARNCSAHYTDQEIRRMYENNRDSRDCTQIQLLSNHHESLQFDWIAAMFHLCFLGQIPSAGLVGAKNLIVLSPDHRQLCSELAAIENQQRSHGYR